MKKILLSALLLLGAASVSAQNDYLQLDLSDNNNIAYDENGVWINVYENQSLHADGLVFSHSAPYGPGYYEGFIASKNTDTKNHHDAAGWTANQWGCMAQGGVDLDSEEGWRANAIFEKPFLINYYSSYSATTNEYGTSYITTAYNGSFYPQGIYVCNTPWGYYGCTEGDGFATPLAPEGGYYKITFHGVNLEAQTTTSIDFYLAERHYSDRNSDGIINDDDNFTLDHWAWCDLSEMGCTDLIYITMDSSDKGEYGMNTSTIVCLDGLKVRLPEAIATTTPDKVQAYATDGNLYISLDRAQEVHIYNTMGEKMMSCSLNAGTHMLNLAHLQHGIYLIQHQQGCVKVRL